MDFKKILNDELKRQHLSYETLGEMCGLTGRAINYYAKGQRIPSVYVAHKILKNLGVQIVLGKGGNHDDSNAKNDRQADRMAGDRKHI